MSDRDIYIKRLNFLADIVAKMMEDVIHIYPDINGFKRTTKLTLTLRESLRNVIPRQSPELKTGGVYIYTPDNNTYVGYKRYNGYKARLIAIGEINVIIKRYDSKDVGECRYFVEVTIPTGGILGSILGNDYFNFYTRRQCLKPYGK